MKEWILGRDFAGAGDIITNLEKKREPGIEIQPRSQSFPLGRGTRLIEIIERAPQFLIITSKKNNYYTRACWI